MKICSARGMTRSRMPLIAMLALAATIGLAGCENGGGGGGGGSTGGGGGGTGPTGPTGPSDVPISQGGDVKDVRDGSGLTAQQIADIGTLVVSLDSAAIANNKPVIEVTVKTDKGGAVLGLAASTLRMGVAKLVPAANNFPSRWQSYINRKGTPSPSTTTPALESATQATTETGAAAGWTELGAGKYRYAAAVDLTAVTSPITVTYEPALTHRVSIAIQLAGDAESLAPDNPYRDFVPNGGVVTTEKLIAATANCAACHVRFAEHGGPRRSVEYCVVCHNPGTVDPDSGESVDLAYMAHSIHRGENRSQGYVVYGFNGSKFDTSDITYPQPASFCETCHSRSAAAPQGDDWQTNPGAASCGGCHDAGLSKTGPDAATGRYTYTYTHSNPKLPGYVANDGTCNGCHRPNGAAGDILDVHKQDVDRKHIENGSLFTYKILKVENAVAGQSPKVTFQILDANQAPINVKTITTGRLRLDFGWSTPDVHNIADVAGDKYQANRGQAIVVDLIANMASVIDNGDGTFSYTLPQPLPSGFADATLGTGLMVVMEGRRTMPDGSDAYPNSAYAFGGGAAREKLVDQKKCEACHKQVFAHGGSRAGDPVICTICHTSSVGGAWVNSNGGTDTFGPLALGAFIHNLHNSKNPRVGAITYPQDLKRCVGCHVAGKFNLARSTALPMTVDAGTTLTSGAATLSWQDDLADSATAGTCKACHDSGAAVTHMQSQGGAFGVAKTLVPSSSSEGCATCHAPGRDVDTAVMHCNLLPYGQCK